MRRTPFVNHADMCELPAEFLALVYNSPPALAEEDTNMGDEAFAYLYEDPDYDAYR